MPGNRTLGVAALAAVLAGAAVQCFLLQRGFYSIGFDEAGRTLDAYAWAFHGVIQTKVWLPFYRVTVGPALRLFPDLVVTPRVVVGLFGLATIPAAAWLAHELFQHRATTLVTLAWAALFSQRVALSVAPLDSMQFAFCILSGMAFLARWMRTGGRGAFWGGAILIAVSETVRYEGWLFGAAFLAASALYRPRPAESVRLWRILAAGAMLAGIPAILAAWLDYAGQSPVRHVMADAAAYTAAEVFRKNPLAEFVVSNAVTLNLVGALSLFLLLRRGERRHRYWIAAAFGPLAAVSLGLLLMKSAQTGPSWRMIAVWSLLLLPFTANALAGEWRGRPLGKRFAWAGLVIMIAASALDISRIVSDSRAAFPEYDHLAGAYFQSQLDRDPQTKIAIESTRFLYLNILVASQHPDAFVLHAAPRQQNPPQPDLRELKENDISLLVFRSQSFTGYLDQQPEIDRIRTFGPWTVYALR